MIPLFKSSYSLHRSILQLDKEHWPKTKDKEKEKDKVKAGPRSIIQLCKDNNIKDVFLVEDGFSGYLEAYENCKNAELNLRFGIRMTICADSEDKSNESLKTEAKFVIFPTTKAGYQQLIKIYTLAATAGFYYVPRFDYKRLQDFWHEDLELAVPFYDSFLYNNLMTTNQCIPELWMKPVFFKEDNGLFFDKKIGEEVDKYCAANGYEVQDAKSIYYEKREDFLAYLTLRCIGKHSSLEKPRVDHMGSCEFCLESYLEKIK